MHLAIARIHLKYYVPALVTALTIGWLSTTGEVQLPPTGLSIDKVGHLVAYAVLAWWLLWGLAKTDRLNRRNLIGVCILGAGYGIALEFVQKWYFPGRFFEVLDMVANLCGIIIGAVVFRISHTQNA